jgi:BRCT domain type II-containing protein
MHSTTDTYQPPDILNHSDLLSYTTIPSPSSPHSQSSTPKSTKSNTKSTPSSSHTSSSKIQKRTLNTMAARRYRQKRVDQVVSLETSLKETQEERDELKLRVARLDAEVDVLRGLVGKK